MDIVTKDVSAKITDTSSGPDEFPGTFLVELSNETLDRDGDVLKASEWELPLPQQISFVNDHHHKMASVVGSAVPELVDGKIICRGTWAGTATGQETRKVIPHVPYTSVAFREKRDRKSGSVSRELINGSFVVVPSNPNAKVLASKSVDELSDDTLVSDLTVKQLRELSSPTVVHNVTLDDESSHGLVFTVDEKSHTVQVRQHGNLLVEHKFSPTPKGAPDETADSPADQVKGKEAAAQALAAANAIVSRMEQE